MDTGFPKEILFQSIRERIKYFEDRTMAHPKLVESYEDLMEKVDVLDGKGDVLLVYGPSGVGKSTLLKKVRNEFINKYYNEMLEDKGLIPILSLEAFAPEDGKFDWIDFYTEALRNLDEVLIEEKRLPLNEIGITVPHNKTKRKLRHALVNAVKHRKVKVILIDEAQHLTKVGNSNGLRNHMDAIKSLASIFGVPIILFGTYELLSFRNINGQLGRRTTEVHFSRYSSEKPDEIKAFKYVLYYFQRAYPLHEEPDLLSEWQYFYKHTIGCVGTLKDWLNKTFNSKMKRKVETKTLTLIDFKKYEPTIDQAYIMAQEITSGETQLTEKREEKENLLNRLLQLEQVDKEEVKKKNTNRKPGERNPKRDKTGTEL